jgi:hypothetical protein
MLGINEGIFKSNRKISFPDWEKFEANNKSVGFLTIRLDEITKIPWGTEAAVSGQLWFKNEQMSWKNTSLSGRN